MTTTQNEIPRAVVETIAGLTAGFLNTLCTHPLDLIKTRLQVNRDSPSKFGASYHIIREISSKEGSFRAFYRGLTPNIIGNTAGWGLYFLWYGEIKALIADYRGNPQNLSSTDYLLASGAAGTLSSIFTNPIWVIKTRMLSTGRSAPGAYRSLTEGFRKIVREEGTKGLFRGMVPALFGVTHGAFQFMFYEELKVWRQRERQQWRILEQLEEDRCQLAQGVEPDSAALEAVPTAALPSEELTNLDFISLSALSKIFAGTVTYPYQVLRARLQTYDADRLYTSTRDVLQKVWRTEGLQGFYKGLAPNLLRVLPSTCITFLVYENTRFYLR